MMNKRSVKYGIVLGTVLVLSIITFSASTLLQTPTKRQEASIVPEPRQPSIGKEISKQPIPRPQEMPIGGQGITLEEAKGWATRSNFTLRLPADTMGRALQSIQPGGPRQAAANDPKQIVSFIDLIYSKQPIDLSKNSLQDLAAQGGFRFVVQKRVAGHNEIIDKVHANKSSPNIAFVLGNPAFYKPPNPQFQDMLVELIWVNGTEDFDLIAGGDHFTKEDLVRIAESIP